MAGRAAAAMAAVRHSKKIAFTNGFLWSFDQLI
jgi:hypothetical protein